MDITKEQLKLLYQKWCTEKMDAAEWQLFIGAIADERYTGWLADCIGKDLEQPDFDELLTEQERSRAYHLLMQQTAAPVKKMRFGYWWAAAAVLLLSIAGYWWIDHNLHAPPVETAKNKEIAPGKEGAILTLANGSQLLLDTFTNGMVALQGGATARVINGALVYESTGSSEVVWNTISVPRGRQYHLTLSDGTVVWLNAASTIRYPVQFTGSTREVRITGEVYMEAASDAGRPFRVNVNDKAAVDVLGTAFNINAYDNENIIATTLIEGKIKVFNTTSQGIPSKLLLPGQQARIAHTNASPVNVISDVDVEKVMAWKNGLFNFNGASLEQVMKQLERWYDIEVVYEQGIPEKKLIGKMTKDVTLNGLLIGLKELDIHYRLENRKLVILP